MGGLAAVRRPHRQHVVDQRPRAGAVFAMHAVPNDKGAHQIALRAIMIFIDPPLAALRLSAPLRGVKAASPSAPILRQADGGLSLCPRISVNPVLTKRLRLLPSSATIIAPLTSLPQSARRRVPA